MNVPLSSNNKPQLQPQSKPPTSGMVPVPLKAKSIKLGVDVHLDRYVVVRVIDVGQRVSPRKMTRLI